jgi:hypothetical protein
MNLTETDTGDAAPDPAARLLPAIVRTGILTLTRSVL